MDYVGIKRVAARQLTLASSCIQKESELNNHLRLFSDKKAVRVLVDYFDSSRKSNFLISTKWLFFVELCQFCSVRFAFFALFFPDNIGVKTGLQSSGWKIFLWTKTESSLFEIIFVICWFTLDKCMLILDLKSLGRIVNFSHKLDLPLRLEIVVARGSIQHSGGVRTSHLAGPGSNISISKHFREKGSSYVSLMLLSLIDCPS